jgi:hypothetical protein
MGLNLIQKYYESGVIGVQYNPSDTTKFVASINAIGIKTYSINNDLILGQNTLKIDL